MDMLGWRFTSILPYHRHHFVLNIRQRSFETHHKTPDSFEPEPYYIVTDVQS